MDASRFQPEYRSPPKMLAAMLHSYRVACRCEVRGLANYGGELRRIE